ncbi:hypothetical protein PoB_003033600 [Plakobranchus ocellatus]|uniref:Uncharacterized protein n=1 Tax=Plakobranchus ocellatus TaxID=259542 RepID=A0AAV4A6D2_9GAST|nr:hypothetical protein PoB_003033600 [Plakobranchus ocellatus]
MYNSIGRCRVNCEASRVNQIVRFTYCWIKQSNCDTQSFTLPFTNQHRLQHVSALWPTPRNPRRANKQPSQTLIYGSCPCNDSVISTSDFRDYVNLIFVCVLLIISVNVYVLRSCLDDTSSYSPNTRVGSKGPQTVLVTLAV